MIRNLQTLIVEGGQTMFEEELWYVRYAAGYGYSVAEQFFKVYSETLVYALFTLISLPILLRRLSAGTNLRNLFSLYGPLVLLSLFFLTLLGLNLGFGPGRFLRHMLIISAMFVGYLSYDAVMKARDGPGKNFFARFRLYLIVTILILISLNVIAKAYVSRYVLQSNKQPTVSEIQGLGWFVVNKADLPAQGMTIPPRRVVPLFLTGQERDKRLTELWDFSHPPYHFYYDQLDVLGTSYN